jgi:hypothetical protein
MINLQGNIQLVTHELVKGILVHSVSVAATAISAMHTASTSSLHSLVSTSPKRELDKHTLRAGRWVKLPFNFNIAPETLSPMVTLRR